VDAALTVCKLACYRICRGGVLGGGREGHIRAVNWKVKANKLPSGWCITHDILEVALLRLGVRVFVMATPDMYVSTPMAFLSLSCCKM
jgi:hypothetical protein